MDDKQKVVIGVIIAGVLAAFVFFGGHMTDSPKTTATPQVATHAVEKNEQAGDDEYSLGQASQGQVIDGLNSVSVRKNDGELNKPAGNRNVDGLNGLDLSSDE